MKSTKGITLIALVITIIILIILAGIGINLTIGENGLFNKSEYAKEQANKQAATEKMNLKITNIQMQIYAQIQRMPTLQEIVDELCIDKEIEYVELQSKKLGSIEKIKIEDSEFVYVKLKQYSYEFRINKTGEILLIDLSEIHEEENNTQKAKESLVMLENFEYNYGESISSPNISSTDKKMGNASLYLNNINITNTDETQFNFISDFTIDYWLKLSGENLNKEWSANMVVGATGGIWIGFNSGKFIVRSYGQVNLIELDAPPTEEWVHIAICRNDGILRVFYNGKLKGQVNDNTNFSKGVLNIGSDGYESYTINSYIDEIRIVNGIAKWTSEFSVPEEEYQDMNAIIYHFNDIDVIKNVAKINDIEKKFGNRAVYINNTDISYKEKAQYRLDKDFTIDYWIKLSEENFDKEWVGNIVVKKVGGIWIGLNSGKFVVRSYDQDNHIEIEPPPTNEWVHVAICRKNGILSVFYNGKLKTQVNNNTNFQQGELYIGSDGGSNYLKNTYMDEIRILNGYCAWTKDFEVPQKEYFY